MTTAPPPKPPPAPPITPEGKSQVFLSKAIQRRLGMNQGSKGISAAIRRERGSRNDFMKALGGYEKDRGTKVSKGKFVAY